MALTVEKEKEEFNGCSDEALVALARKGVENAIRVLIKRNNRRLFRIARAVIRDDGEAEDIVQETYVKAFTRLDSFRGESSFSTWLTRIALNEAMSSARKSKPITGLAELETIAADAQGAQIVMFPNSIMPPDAHAELGRSQVRQLLEVAVDELPDAFRIVFIMRDVQELTIEETAAQLSLKPETVKTRLHRARRMLRTAIEKRLSSGFSELFPFDGARCERMADRVIERLAVADA